MDDLEFRKQAVIDPASQDDQFLQKTSQSPHNKRFVKEQLEFEQILNSVLDVEVPENLSDKIILNQQLSQHKISQHKKRYQSYKKWAVTSIAASLLLMLSVHLLIPDMVDNTQLAAHIITHVQDDTHALNVNMPIAKTQIDTMLASYGGKLNGPIGQVSFLGHCIVGGQTGIHMVLNTQQGLVTVLILPAQAIEESLSFADNQYKGFVYPTQKGSVAIVAENLSIIKPIQQKIDQNLNWII